MILAVLIITGISTYLRMDSKRFASQRVLKKLQPELANWLALAEEMMKMERDESLKRDYYELRDSIGSARIKELEKSIRKINQVHRSLKRTAADNIGDSAVTVCTNQLAECYSGFVYERTMYNEYISAVNSIIRRGSSAWVAKLIGMKEFEKLDDLAII